MHAVKNDVEMITVAEAAARAGRTANRIREWAAAGWVGSSGRPMLINSADLVEVLRVRGTRRPRPKLRLVVDNAKK